MSSLCQEYSILWVLMTERGIQRTRTATVGVVYLVHDKAAPLMCRDTEASLESLCGFLWLYMQM